jgi:hypothetical protein
LSSIHDIDTDSEEDVDFDPRDALRRLRHGIRSDRDWGDPNIVASVLYKGEPFKMTEGSIIIREVVYLSQPPPYCPMARQDEGLAIIFDARGDEFTSLQKSDGSKFTPDGIIGDHVRIVCYVERPVLTHSVP